MIDGDFQGRKLWLDCWLTPAALPQSKRDLAKLSVEPIQDLAREPLAFDMPTTTTRSESASADRRLARRGASDGT